MIISVINLCHIPTTFIMDNLYTHDPSKGNRDASTSHLFLLLYCNFRHFECEGKLNNV